MNDEIYISQENDNTFYEFWSFSRYIRILYVYLKNLFINNIKED